MNYLCASTTSLFFVLILPCLLKSQSQLFIGINGSGWPRNLQVRGVLQGTRENRNSAQQVELGYVQRENYSIRNPLPNAVYFYQPLIGAVELSVFWKVGINFEQVRVFGLIGPSVSHGIETEAFVVNESGDSYRAIIPWQQLGIRKWELGTYVGCGIENINRKGVKIQVDFRYYIGLSDLLPGEASAYNQGALLGMGICMPLKKRTAE
jgi:hypothetical protein